MALMDILKQYVEASTSPNADTASHYDQVAQQAPADDLAKGIAASLRSDATPSFGESIGTMFGQSNPQQRATLLNQLLASIPPGALAGLLGGPLGSVLGAAGGGAAPTVTPDVAANVSPAQASEVATHAEQHDPTVVDRVGSFCAQHPDLVKTLGAVALGMVMNRMSARRA